MIVVDASAALNGLLSSGDARRRVSLEPVAVPHLVDSEICHSLRRLVRVGAIGLADAELCLRYCGQPGLLRFGVATFLGRIWELRDNLSAYDATYVALAEALECGLLTADNRLSRAPGLRCPVTVLPN